MMQSTAHKVSINILVWSVCFFLVGAVLLEKNSNKTVHLFVYNWQIVHTAWNYQGQPGRHMNHMTGYTGARPWPCDILTGYRRT